MRVEMENAEELLIDVLMVCGETWLERADHWQKAKLVEELENAWLERADHWQKAKLVEELENAGYINAELLRLAGK